MPIVLILGGETSLAQRGEGDASGCKDNRRKTAARLEFDKSAVLQRKKKKRRGPRHASPHEVLSQFKLCRLAAAWSKTERQASDSESLERPDYTNQLGCTELTFVMPANRTFLFVGELPPLTNTSVPRGYQIDGYGEKLRLP